MAASEVRFINRELSWLEFNQRVLDEARNSENPLLERLKFLAITSSNLDEFFMVRVGGLQMLSQQSRSTMDLAGMTAEQQLTAIRKRVDRMAADQYRCLLEELEPELAKAGIRRLTPAELGDRQRNYLEQLVTREIAAVFTPQAVSEEDEFPLLQNQTLNLCVRLDATKSKGDACERFAIIPFGRVPQRLITLQSENGYEFILLEDVISLWLECFLPGEKVVECAPFRITRNADMSLREDMASDLMAGMEEILDARKQSATVRLEIADAASKALVNFLSEQLGAEKSAIYRLPGPLDLAAFFRLADIKGFDDLRYAPWPPQRSAAIDPSLTIFETLSQRDLLLYHPYENFEPVLQLIEQAADDPDVLAIKQTLYRTSRNSPVVAALMRAAENGKYVTVLVELKARFDEERNINWARELEQAGVQVIYGVKELKTHAKICIIVRREPQGIRRYVHFGTGNYNEATARLYTDASYLTATEVFGMDASAFFNAIAGDSQLQRFQKIEIAPLGIRDKLLELIAGEIRRKRDGQTAKIQVKVNSLADPELINALYDASQAGVEIKLNIRGVCCLRPGVPGLSENIEVISIIDRFLEHSRIAHFHHGGDNLVFISSADWMPRNLDRRVELLVPVEDKACRERLLHILQSCFRDNTKARRLLADGGYENVKARKKSKRRRSQEQLYEEARAAIEKATRSQRTTFEPYRADSQPA